MSRIGRLSRRAFLVGAAAVGGGVALGYYYYQRDPGNPLEDLLAEGEAAFNPYLKIGSDNSITIYTGRAEMGQGVSTTLAAYVAEELNVDLDQVVVEHGPVSSAYGNVAMLEETTITRSLDAGIANRLERGGMAILAEMTGMQVTGGSSSTRDGFVKMRAAGCAAREMLIAAAAERLGVDAGDPKAEGGFVISGEDRIPYGDLAERAAAMTPPEEIVLRAASDWRLLGKSQVRTDLLPKVTGAPIFGADVDLPDMVHATIRISPRFGANVLSYDDAAALEVPGVEKIVRIDTADSHGFGVIASNTWAAFKGAEAIEVEWEDAPYPATHEDILDGYKTALDAERGFAFRDVGDAAGALADAPSSDIVEAEYEAPFLAHTCMEPMNATAQLKDGELTIWAPTQAPTFAAMAAAAVTGVDRKSVKVNTTFLGGGFGRRGESDYVRFAALMAAHTDGRPVKVTWTREEDTRHDMYRPAAVARFRAVAKAGAAPTALHAKIAAPSIQQSIIGRTLIKGPFASPDRLTVEGAFDQPYDFEDVTIRGVNPAQTIPIGFWRSVGNSYNGFFHETFLDEVAIRSGLDPVEMRLELMANYPTAQKTLEKAADMAGWGRDPGAGRGLGVAFTFSFGSWVAEIVEVSDTEDGISIDRVWAAADVGIALDPDIVAKQIQSGIVYGLSSAMNQKITLVDGEVQESNFWDYDAMRMSQCPEIEVAVLENAPKMGGAGEPGMPPSVPALGNAIFAATGERLRRLPFGDEVDFVQWG